MKPGRRTSHAIFTAPAAIAVLSLLGLVAALTGDGPPDILAWATLAAPVAALLWAMRARRS